MIHGLRNNTSGALTKFVIAKRKVNVQLGYKNSIIGYSYDSNTTGAQYILHPHFMHYMLV